jgi:hypothetical protein
MRGCFERRACTSVWGLFWVKSIFILVCCFNDALGTANHSLRETMLRGWTGRLIFLLRLDGECLRARWRIRLLTTYHTGLQKPRFHVLLLFTSPDWRVRLFGYIYTCTGSCRARWVRRSPICWTASLLALLVIGSRRNNLETATIYA